MGKGVLPIYHLALRAKKPKPQGYPTAPTTLGGHLKRRRLDLGLIQRDLAAKIGADEASVWLWENDRVQPGLTWIPAILGLLGHDPRPAPQTIGQRLVRYREARGWSQKRLAEALNVDPGTLSRWERGKRAPGGQYAERIKSLVAGLT